jgi:hypothetical protein
MEHNITINGALKEQFEERWIGYMLSNIYGLHHGVSIPAICDFHGPIDQESIPLHNAITIPDPQPLAASPRPPTYPARPSYRQTNSSPSDAPSG